MPTLRELSEKENRRTPIRGTVGEAVRYNDGFFDALREYGDYRVIEGRLEIVPPSCLANSSRELMVVRNHMDRGVPLGLEGDRIKLLVPPEGEPVADCDQSKDARIAELEAALERAHAVGGLAVRDIAHEVLRREVDDDA